MATFNGSEWLPEQLRSLARQTRLPDELVIFDDRSTDSTEKILCDFASSAPFKVRIQIQPRNVGATKNFAAAITAADGDVIAPCDQDDVWYPDKLQRIEAEFARDASVDLVFTDADVVDRSLQPLGYTVWESIPFTAARQARAQRAGLARTLVRFNVVTGAAMAFAARWRSLLLPIPETWVHDGWIALLISAVGQCRWIPAPTIAYRQHARQQIGAQRLSFARQLKVAREMDKTYFDLQAVNFAAALQRLKNQQIPVHTGIIDLLAGKVRHCRRRTEVRARSHGWLSSVLQEYAGGRYSAYSFGWKSVAQDIVLVEGTR